VVNKDKQMNRLNILTFSRQPGLVSAPRVGEYNWKGNYASLEWSGQKWHLVLDNYEYIMVDQRLCTDPTSIHTLIASPVLWKRKNNATYITYVTIRDTSPVRITVDVHGTTYALTHTYNNVYVQTKTKTPSSWRITLSCSANGWVLSKHSVIDNTVRKYTLANHLTLPTTMNALPQPQRWLCGYMYVTDVYPIEAGTPRSHVGMMIDGMQCALEKVSTENEYFARVNYGGKEITVGLRLGKEL